MKNVLAIVTLSSLMTGCSSFAPQPSRPDTVVAEENSASVITGDTKSGAAQNEDALPALPLTQDLLFKLMSAEIAQQRGQWQSAYVTILAAAQQTRDPRLARRAAEIAVNAKRADEALPAIRLWRELAPKSEEATQYLIGVILLGDDIESVRPIFVQRLSDARPQLRTLMIYQAQRLLSRAKNKAAAFAMLEDVLKPYLTMPEAHIALALGAFGAGDNLRARTEAKEALAAKPDSELFALSLAQVTPDKDLAVSELASFLATYPKSREARLSYARLLAEQKKYGDAHKEFEILLKQKPDDLTSLFALGMLDAQTEDFKSAEKYLTTYLNVLEKKPDDERDPTQALLTLADLAEQRKDIDGALKWLSQIDSGESYLGAQVKRAQLIAKRGDLVGARAVLSDIKPEGDREQGQLIMAEALILRDANQLPEALTVLEGGVKRFPTNPDLLYDYAMLAEKSDNLPLMESSLRKLIEIAPSNQHAYNALGYSLAERNIRLPEAYTLIEKALALTPEDPFIIDSMGWVQFRLGKLEDAEASLRRAYELRPDPEIGVHLGEVLWVKGQKEAAQKLWRDANTKDPKNGTLKSTLSRLHVSL